MKAMRWMRGPGTAGVASMLGVAVLLLGMCAGDVLVTMGNRDWASSSKVRRDIATWTSWDTPEEGFGSGIQQQILYAVDSPRYPPSSQVDEHGVRTYWMVDAASCFQYNYCPVAYCVPTTLVAQLWAGQGLDESSQPITVLKVLVIPLDELNGMAVAEGMLSGAAEYVIAGTFEPTVFLYLPSRENFLVSDSGGLTYRLPFNYGYDDGGFVVDDPWMVYNITDDNPELTAIVSSLTMSVFVVSIAADSEGHPYILFDNAISETTGMEGLLTPSVGGNCLAGLDYVMAILLWNTASDAYEIFAFAANATDLESITYDAHDVYFVASTGLTDRNCGATTSTTAPVMINGGGDTLLIFCQGFVTVVNVGDPSVTRVVPGYIHGVVWAQLVSTYDQEGTYKFSEAAPYPETGNLVSWDDLRASQSQLFWLTSTNTADQVNCLMESDVLTAEYNVQTANVLQWMPDVVSSSSHAGDSPIHSMAVHCSASDGDFLFYSATIETPTGHEEAIVAVDVRTVQGSREFAVFLPANGMAILQLVYDVVDNCLYGLQEVYSSTDSETRVVEIFASLVKIPLSTDATVNVSTVLDLSGWSVVSSDVMIRTVSPHVGLEDVPSAYDPYHHAWMFVDGLYGELMVLDPHDGSMWAVDIDWAGADVNSRFALSLTYDSEQGVLYVLAPLLSAPVFMEVAAVSFTTSSAEVFYADQLVNEFSFALDCVSCFVAMHAGSHSLILRSQFAVVVYPLDDVTHSPGSNPSGFTLSVLDSGDWEFLLSSPLVTSPAPLSPFSFAIPLAEFSASFLGSSISTPDVVLLTSSSFEEPSPSTTSPSGSGNWLFISVAAVCALFVVVVIAVLVIIAKRTAVLGQPSILAHATPVFDDEISDKDL